MDKYITEMCVRGFHAYQNVWRPIIVQELKCERDEDNNKDRFVIVK